MAKPLFPPQHIYIMYLVLSIAGLWGFISYFTLAYLYFTVTHAVFFWIPALTIFLPATIALVLHGTGPVAITLLLAVVYSIVLTFGVLTCMRGLLKKPGAKKHHRKKARIKS